MADLEAVRAKWRQVLQSTDDEATIERAHEVLRSLARQDPDPKMQQIVSSYDRGKEKIEDAAAEPDPMSAGEVAGAIGERYATMGKAIGRGVKEVVTHPVDTITVPERRRELLRGVDDATTLGHGRKLADWLSRDVIGSKDPTFAETEAGDRAAAPDVRAGGSAFGILLPSPVSKVFSAPGKLIAPGKTVAGEAVRSAGRAVAGYEATAPAMAALKADGGTAKERLEAAGDAALDPGGLVLSSTLGAGAGGAKKYVGGAPARAEESELGALAEGVQHKTRVNRYLPNKEEIRAALNEAPDIRAKAKTDPVAASEMATERYGQIADAELQPFYDGMKQAGLDNVAWPTVKQNLQAVRSGFNRHAEKAQIAVVDDLVQSLEAEAKQNGGAVPVDSLREAATSLQKQGHAGVPMFGMVPLPKVVKQQIGGALRRSISEHIDQHAGSEWRGAYEQANRRVSAWARIDEILAEKADRIEAKARPMGDLVQAGHAVVDAAKNPLKAAGTAALKLAGPAFDAMDRRVLGPAVNSGLGRFAAPGMSRAADAAPRFSLPFPGFMEAPSLPPLPDDEEYLR